MQVHDDMNSDGNLPMIQPLTDREMEILRLISRGLSNREIASELVLTSGTVKWYNRQIYSKLGVHSRTQAVAQAKKAGLFDPTPETTLSPGISPEHNLPAQVTSFIGRDHEIEEITHLLRTTRLITLTGPGGSGKTRLALQAAIGVMERFEDGVFLVNLAPISDPQFVPSTIAQVLGIWEAADQQLIETIKIYLLEKHTLLLLGNFEQILDAAPLVGELLSSSPGLKIMVTSREALQIYGEQEYPVPPLPVPDLDRIEPLGILLQNESVQLFQQRAKAVKPDFEITSENAPTIAEICVRLDGLPLAIELAAARSKLLSPEMMRSRLESRLAMLTIGSRDVHPRLQTLRGTLDWSYDLLDAGERTLFGRLSVFQGGRTIESLDAVCAPGLSIEVLDGLESLLNKNLLFHKEGPVGEPRFYMLETIHEYADEKLVESGETEDIRRRHAEYFARLAAQAESELFAAKQGYWIARLRCEHDNLRAALAWSLEGADFVLGSQIVGTLQEFWYREGFIVEGLRWTEHALVFSEDIPLRIQAKVNIAAGHLIFAQGDYESCEHFYREALVLSQKSGDDVGRAWALIFLARNLGAFPGEVEERVRFCEEGLVLFRELGDMHGITRALNNLGDLARLVGDYERAKDAYEECRALSLQRGDKHLAAAAVSNLSYVAMHKGDYLRAAALLREGLTMAVEHDFKHSLGVRTAMLTGPVCASGQPELAARLFGASESILQGQDRN
jgi:predicted ATPase/DNA-binding CsgD family transcriptional regulator